jgi:hypothetical protein
MTEARNNVLQFQTAEERLKTQNEQSQAELLALAEQILTSSEAEARKMKSIWLSKGQQIADRFAELRKRADKLRAK